MSKRISWLVFFCLIFCPAVGLAYTYTGDTDGDGMLETISTTGGSTQGGVMITEEGQTNPRTRYSLLAPLNHEIYPWVNQDAIKDIRVKIIQDINGDGAAELIGTFYYSTNHFNYSSSEAIYAVFVIDDKARREYVFILSNPGYYDRRVTSISDEFLVDDLNGDGKKEIIGAYWSSDYTPFASTKVLGKKGCVYVIDLVTGQNSVYDMSPQLSEETPHPNAFTLADLDGNGTKEIFGTFRFLNTSSSSRYGVFVVNQKDKSCYVSTLSGRSTSTTSYEAYEIYKSEINKPFMTDDLDGNGIKEIFGTFRYGSTDSGDSKYAVYVINYSEKQDYVYSFSPQVAFDISGTGTIPKPLTVTDTNGDGKKEIAGVYCYGYGTASVSYAKKFGVFVIDHFQREDFTYTTFFTSTGTGNVAYSFAPVLQVMNADEALGNELFGVIYIFGAEAVFVVDHKKEKAMAYPLGGAIDIPEDKIITSANFNSTQNNEIVGIFKANSSGLKKLFVIDHTVYPSPDSSLVFSLGINNNNDITIWDLLDCKDAPGNEIIGWYTDNGPKRIFVIASTDNNYSNLSYAIDNLAGSPIVAVGDYDPVPNNEICVVKTDGSYGLISAAYGNTYSMIKGYQPIATSCLAYQLAHNSGGGTPSSLDSDGDGVIDEVDAFPYNGSESRDSDGDGVGDNLDFAPGNPYEWQDSDGNGVGDNFDPKGPGRLTDADVDGLPDGVETGCTSRSDADSDDDGLLDGREDANLNGKVDPGETDPCLADTDNDGLPDGLELGVGLAVSTDTNPAVFIADQDTTTRTNPLNADTDGDGVTDGMEDKNHNGRVDSGETDPNVAETPIAAKYLTQFYFYHTDYMGTPLAITDETGERVWSAEYFPFGEIFAVDSSIENNRRFVGNELDAETSLGNFKARFLDYGLGRFLSTDPIRPVDPRIGKINERMLSDPQRLNLYAYALNDPINLTDSFGLWAGTDDAIFIVGGAIVGVLGRGVGDILTMKRSTLEDYAGSAVGGATAGETLLYTANPFLAGAAGGLAGNLTTQGLNNHYGKQCGIDFISATVDTAFGTATGFIPGKPRISGINAGRGSDLQVFRQIVTRAANGTVKNISPVTAAKMGRGAFYEYASGQGAAAGALGSTLYGKSSQ